MTKLVIVALLCGACAGSTTESRKSTARPLYDRLGGKGAIAAVVEDFVGRVAKDPRINARFSNTDIPHLKQMLTEQICEASGGPCKYTGKDMKTSHAGLKISDDEFNAMVEDLQAALTALHVATAEQRDLIGAIAPMKPDIVNQ